MQQSEIGTLVQAAFWVVLRLGGPPLGAALVVGLVMSLIQAVTQINEPTLAFVPKVAAVVATLLLLGAGMMAALSDFTHMMFDRLIVVGGS